MPPFPLHAHALRIFLFAIPKNKMAAIVGWRLL